jgi:dTDP-4-amino-4,6-dideoxygalactose transaminase
LGLYAFLTACGYQGAEVVLPALTCSTVADAVVASGNHPVFVDIEPSSYNLDVRAVRRALNSRTRAVIATHLYGYPMDVAGVRDLVGSDPITVVEDCAHLVPGSNHSACGLTGDLALYSFGRGKPMCTVRGGMVVTDNDELYERIRDYRSAFMDGLSARSRGRLWAWLLASYVVYGRWTYGLWRRARATASRCVRPVAIHPENVAASAQDAAFADFQGRIGCKQLARYDAMLAHRRMLAELYREGLAHVPGVDPAPAPEDATYGYYTVRVPNRDARGFPERMQKEGVVVGSTFDQALPDMARWRAARDTGCGNAREAASEVANLPVHPAVRNTDARQVMTAVHRALERH